MLAAYSGILLLAGIGIAAGGPRLLSRRPWVYRHPRTALAAWMCALMLGGSCLVTSLCFILVGALEIAMKPITHVPTAWECACAAGVYVLGWVLTAGVGGLGSLALYRAGQQTLRDRRRRDQISGALLAAAIPGRVGDQVVAIVSDDTPLAVAIPGRPPLVAITTGLIDNLSEEELHSVIAHERAHLAQRHTLVAQLAAIQRACLPWLPAARGFEAAVRTLTELAADDAAVRCYGTQTTASALRKTARSNESMLTRANRLEVASPAAPAKTA